MLPRTINTGFVLNVSPTSRTRFNGRIKLNDRESYARRVGGRKMSYLLDVYYLVPEDAAREARISELAAMYGGRFWSKGETSDGFVTNVWLQYDFDERDAAVLAQKAILKPDVRYKAV